MTYKFRDITNDPRIEVIEVSKSGTGIHLSFTLDGREGWAVGEFYIDRNNVLHHTAMDDNGTEIEMLIQLEL